MTFWPPRQLKMTFFAPRQGRMSEPDEDQQGTIAFLFNVDSPGVKFATYVLTVRKPFFGRDRPTRSITTAPWILDVLGYLP